jgi:SAM-dependent methyltransferase
MATEPVPLPAIAAAWTAPTSVASREDEAATATLVASETLPTPPDEHLAAVAERLPPGKALDLGCGEGIESIWLAQLGWVVTAVDPSAEKLAAAHERATEVDVGRTIVFEQGDLTRWQPASRFDLVFCTMSLPARGQGRSRLLETAVDAVAQGGTIVLSDLDGSLGREEWMTERFLVTTEELRRAVDGFRIERSAVRLTSVRHGYDQRVLPVALVVATRRTDLRTLP